MEKFQAWHVEHEANIERRSNEHRKAKQAKKHVPVVKKVEEVVAEVAPVAAAETEEPTAEA
jgi:small subunit ribosomal protein S16